MTIPADKLRFKIWNNLRKHWRETRWVEKKKTKKKKIFIRNAIKCITGFRSEKQSWWCQLHEAALNF